MSAITTSEKIAIMELALQGISTKEPSPIEVYKQMLEAITVSESES